MKAEEVHQLLSWLSLLQEGYVKPDVYARDNKSSNGTGIIRDTKEYMEHIVSINKKLAEHFELDSVKIKRKEIK